MPGPSVPISSNIGSYYAADGTISSASGNEYPDRPNCLTERQNRLPQPNDDGLQAHHLSDDRFTLQ